MKKPLILNYASDTSFTFHDVPNGGYAVLDENNKLLAYTKTRPDNVSATKWQWIKKSHQIKIKENNVRTN